jgi:Flp pilus assembly pilin Flp
MKKTATLVKELIKDESGQGATEYILLLVVVVGLAMIFKNSIMETVKAKLAELGSSIGGFTSSEGGG